MEIKNLKKAAKRIIKAVKNKEKIILYGDADLDGAAAVLILKEAIKNLGGNIISLYFPDREKEGYGISQTGLEYLKKFAPALLVTLDLGIGNFKEVKIAKKLGFEVIIVDHHEILGKIPSASVVVDPKQKGDEYGFKGLAAAGLSFKLAELLLAKKFSRSLKNNFLELTALATIADMMPREKDNKIFIEEGMKSLENSWRPGLKAIFKVKYFDDFPNLSQKISKLIYILNVRDVKDGQPASFRLLDVRSLAEAEEMIEGLIKKTERRREMIQEALVQAEERLMGSAEKIIFEGDENWEYVLISAVASILCQKYQKPAFIFKKLKKESQGTVRTPSNVNGVSLMGKCQDLLLTYGGHPVAAGFRVKNENLEKFKECLIKNYA